MENSINSCNYLISSKDTDGDQVMNLKSDNIEVMACDNVDGVIEEIFESLLSKHPVVLEASMKRSNFIFNSGQQLYCKCLKMSFNAVNDI